MCTFYQVVQSKTQAFFIDIDLLNTHSWIDKCCRDGYKWEMHFSQNKRKRIKSPSTSLKNELKNSRMQFAAFAASVCHNHFSFSLQSSKGIKPNEVRGVTRAVSNYTVDLFNAASMRNAQYIIRVPRRITVILRDKPLIFIRDRPSWDSASVICREGDH